MIFDVHYIFHTLKHTGCDFNYIQMGDFSCKKCSAIAAAIQISPIACRTDLRLNCASSDSDAILEKSGNLISCRKIYCIFHHTCYWHV